MLDPCGTRCWTRTRSRSRSWLGARRSGIRRGILIGSIVPRGRRGSRRGTLLPSAMRRRGSLLCRLMLGCSRWRGLMSRWRLLGRNWSTCSCLSQQSSRSRSLLLLSLSPSPRPPPTWMPQSSHEPKTSRPSSSANSRFVPSTSFNHLVRYLLSSCPQYPGLLPRFHTPGGFDLYGDVNGDLSPSSHSQFYDPYACVPVPMPEYPSDASYYSSPCPLSSFGFSDPWTSEGSSSASSSPGSLSKPLHSDALPFSLTLSPKSLVEDILAMPMPMPISDFSELGLGMPMIHAPVASQYADLAMLEFVNFS